MTTNAMDFTIRQAQIQDAAGIARVQVESWRTTYVDIVPREYLASLNPVLRTEKWREQFNQDGMFILVAEDASGVFGFVNGGRSRDDINRFDAELYAIYLLQRRQKQGIGRALVRRFAEALAEAAFQSLLVWVLAKNPAVEFYRRLGGSPVAQKEIAIGGVRLTELAFGWADLQDLT